LVLRKRNFWAFDDPTDVGPMKMIRLALGLLLGVLLTNLVGCDEGQQPQAVIRPTKAEWRANFGGKFGPIAQMGIIENLKPAQFKAALGEPNSTQTIGDQAYWYYECSDGTIQLELFAPNLAVGMMQGKVNDY
jgi:hypothetical protein